MDSLRRLTAPGPSPYVDSLGGAKKGIKRVIVKAMCSDANAVPHYSNQDDSLHTFPVTVCPESLYAGLTPPASRTKTSLVPHFLEIVDGRFSVLGPGVDYSPPAPMGDCVVIDVKLTPGVAWSHYKATYPV